MSTYWGHFARHGTPGTGNPGNLPAWLPWQADENFLLFDSGAGGGIRMTRTGVDRDRIFRELAGDGDALGGQAGVCLAYQTLFGEDAMFGFTAACPRVEEDCAGAESHFCPKSP
jgi:para-nitrobenzyl esterase